MKLTKAEAYKAMYAFLDEYYNLFKEEGVSSEKLEIISDLLSNMEFFPYSPLPIDQSLWKCWENSIVKAQKGKVKLVKEFASEEALEKYRKERDIPDYAKKEQI